MGAGATGAADFSKVFGHWENFWPGGRRRGGSALFPAALPAFSLSGGISDLKSRLRGLSEMRTHQGINLGR